MLNIAVVDDNELDTSRLEKSIIDFCNRNNVVFSIEKYDRALKFFDNYSGSFDVIFLDIDMPIMNGMEAAYKIRETSPNVAIVFVTNYSSLAIRGYGVGALDFLLKPVKQDDVDILMKKIITKVDQEKDDTKIVIKVKSGFQTIRVADIKYVEVATHDIYYHCVMGTYRSRGVLKEIEANLNNPKFVKCSNCYLINLEYIESIVKDDVKIDGKMLKMSRNKKKDFIDAYLKNFN